MSMDFIEDHIVRNGFITEEQKLRLIYCEEMAPYSFIGALIHYSIISSQEEEDTTKGKKDNILENNDNSNNNDQ